MANELAEPTRQLLMKDNERRFAERILARFTLFVWRAPRRFRRQFVDLASLHSCRSRQLYRFGSNLDRPDKNDIVL